jgi:signal transduction histidine kinase
MPDESTATREHTSATARRRDSATTVDCLAHDLKNVFQTIVEAADLLRSDSNWTPVADIIVRSVEQGRRIVESVLEVDRATVVEDIVGAAAEFATDFAAAVGGPLLAISHAIEPGLRCVGRASMIERALVNLFVNSAQAARAAGASRCSIHVQAAAARSRVVITISDDGPGFPPEILPAIFTPRFTTKEGGAGLGLHIVRRAIDESGGSVKARNGDHGGAVFEITLLAPGKIPECGENIDRDPNPPQFDC